MPSVETYHTILELFGPQNITTRIALFDEQNSCAWVAKENNRYNPAKPVDPVRNAPLKFELAGGGAIESDRDVEATAIREAEEELNRKPEKLWPIGTILEERDGQPKAIVGFLGRVSGRRPTIDVSHDVDADLVACGWRSLQKLEKTVVSDADRLFLRQIRRFNLLKTHQIQPVIASLAVVQAAL